MTKTCWEFTGETRIEFGVELKQIRAVCDFGFVVKGDLGGWISDKVKLAQNGRAWIGKLAKAFGGIIEGGTIEGGIIEGGIIEGGTIWGGDFLTVSPIGSENGQFTAEITAEGQIICNRGCFSGTLEKFEAAVAKTHGTSPTAVEYGLVVQLVRARLEPIAAERRQKLEAAQ
jgi:hypothetical protein